MDWWKDYFDRSYLQRYIFDSETTVAEVLMLRDLLPEAPADILDLACGQGRHSIGLAQCGYHVIGLDASTDLLDVARSEAEGVSGVEFVHGDMRQIPYVECFDGVICMFTSFGYFDDAENLTVLQGIVRSLKPGGRLIMEMAHRDRVVNGFRETDWYEQDDGTIVWIRRVFDPIRGTLISIERWRDYDDNEDERHHRIRLYSASELAALLHRAGLDVTDWYGSHNLHAFSYDAPRMIVVAQKPFVE